MQATSSQLAQALLLLKGQPLSLEKYKPFEYVYDCDPPVLTACCGRQIGKSNSIGASLVTKAIIRPYFNSLYVAPLSDQASRFSTMYLDPYLNSHLVKKHYRDGSSRKNVFEKSLSTGSLMFLGYGDTENELDRLRGIAADLLCVDEVQDIEHDALPALYETLSASNYGFKRHFGTAKNENNTLTQLMKESNQLEWATKCDHCGKWTIPWDEESCIKMCSNSNGPACVHCGGAIDVSKGKWVAARPDIKNHFGFHIPQFAIGARVTEKKWPEILEKLQKYPRAKFLNEVCGLPIGMGGRILSVAEAMACSDTARTEFDTCFPQDSRGINVTVLGVDWSVTDGVASYTVVTIYGFDFQGKSYNMYSLKLNGIDILEQVRIVATLFRKYNCSAIGSDRGVGVLQGQLLQQELGIDKVFMINYVAGKVALRYDRQGMYYAADRTQAIDSVIIKMKMGPSRFSTPAWSIMAPFWQDALNVYEEESQSGRRLYRKEKIHTDDWLHSTVFAHLAYAVINGQAVLTEEI